MPDWCVWNYDHGDLANYVDQGLVKQLPDDWKTKFPNVAAAQERCQLAGLDEELFGGQGLCPWTPLKGLSPLRIPYLRPLCGLRGIMHWSVCFG